MIPLPPESYNPAQLALALAPDGTPGGYKTPSLIGLAWSAPYLHDGSVATQLGVAGTLKRNVLPDPANRLRTLMDSQLRQQVIDASQADPDLRAVRI